LNAFLASLEEQETAYSRDEASSDAHMTRYVMQEILRPNLPNEIKNNHPHMLLWVEMGSKWDEEQQNLKSPKGISCEGRFSSFQ